jgi:hypothetical protein
VVNLRDHDELGMAMDLLNDDDDLRKSALKTWYDYGIMFDVFDPQEQPAPSVWNPELPEPDDNGTSDPQVIKHWRMLDLTRRFLRERYAAHGMFTTPSLKFDCLAAHFQKPIPIDPDERESRGWPAKGDPPTWHGGCLRMGIFGWAVGFSCSSTGCRRNWCKLNLANPKRINPVDVYSLLMIFEEFSLPKAKSEVQKWFGGKLGKFSYAGKEKNRKPWYAVPKEQLMRLIADSADVRHQDVQPLIKAATALIRDSAVVDWHLRLFSDDLAYFSTKIISDALLTGIGSPAIRLYLWLLVRQEEEARHNRYELALSDTVVAEALGVDRSTIGRYRKHLVNMGLLQVDGNVWKPKYSTVPQYNKKMKI